MVKMSFSTALRFDKMDESSLTGKQGLPREQGEGDLPGTEIFRERRK